MRALVAVWLSLLVVTPALADDGAQPTAAAISATVVFRDGHVTYTVAPRVAEGGRLLVVLAFPSAPETRPLPPAAVDALHAVAALELPPEATAPAAPSSTELPDTALTLLPARASFEAWAKERADVIDEEARARAAAFLDAGWKLVALSGDEDTPAFGFRFRADGPLVPPDLLTMDDERQRALLGAGASGDVEAEPAKGAREDNRILRLLDKVWGD